MEKGAKVVLVVCGDRAMQDALREIVISAGCHMIAADTVVDAERRLPRQKVALVLVDPLVGGDAALTLASCGPLVEIPVRTSATGVRRLAKHNAGAVKWMKDLVAAHCRSADGG